ncbi:glutamyl-tRNA reductase [Brevibacterium sp. 5221]|uniref:Multifunctional fusion protein n=1 Tax=Brevibacterium rongguiense TaxID=2695267 RepID=A0A6N9H8L3_9MICO|nr:glutamyl-tRNA reductase [Brevibacterium rongguiense]MYM19914.1 glutamyl-tRNA reductase [Brevibacterium rongguiense]
MTLLVLGINHRSAPMSVLDAIALDREGIAALRAGMLAGEYVSGGAALATCNRVELIADVTSFHGGLADMGSALVTATGLDWRELAQYLTVYFDDRAQEHLFTVAAGLDSMALGEAQILGQLRRAYTAAREAGALSGPLTRALEAALELGKRAHAETSLDSVSQSLLDAALTAAAHHVGPIAQANALIIGAGAMSGLAAATLARAGTASITILNRTLVKAQRLADSVGGRAVEFDEQSLIAEVAAADVVISVTGARGTVLDRDRVIAALQAKAKPRQNTFLVDLALPHDIAPDVADLPHIRLLGLEDLSRMFADASQEAGSDVIAVIAEVRGLIREAMDADAQRRAANRISPTVAALREQAAAAVEAEFERVANKLGERADAAVLKEIRKSLRRTADKIIHTPTVRVKELSAEDSGVDYAAALTTLFDLSSAPAVRADTISDLQRPGAAPMARSGPSAAPRRPGGAERSPVAADGLTPVADHTLDVVEPAHYTGRTVKLGTRRSQLARAQSTALAQQLAAQTGWRVEICEVVTEGDINMTPLAALGGTGVFVSAVRTALLTGKVDIAVHSLKDLPTAPAAGIDLAAVPPRVDPSDVLIARDGLTLAELPAGSVVGTGSPRRAAQLRAARPDIEVRGVRGNVDTRIRHVTEGRLDGVVLAAAGVRRLGRLSEVTDVLATSVMLPAPGQGALAVECRAADADIAATDAELREALAGLHDEAAALCVLSERAVLSRAEAGCSAPIGALAELDGEALTLTAVMADDEGRLQQVSRFARLAASVGSADAGAAADNRRSARELGYLSADELLGALGEVPGTSAPGANAPRTHVETARGVSR